MQIKYPHSLSIFFHLNLFSASFSPSRPKQTIILLTFSPPFHSPFVHSVYPRYDYDPVHSLSALSFIQSFSLYKTHNYDPVETLSTFSFSFWSFSLSKMWLWSYWHSPPFRSPFDHSVYPRHVIMILLIFSLPFHSPLDRPIYPRRVDYDPTHTFPLSFSFRSFSQSKTCKDTVSISRRLTLWKESVSHHPRKQPAPGTWPLCIQFSW